MHGTRKKHHGEATAHLQENNLVIHSNRINMSNLTDIEIFIRLL